MLESGTLIGNRYRVLERLGKGGMGEVYAAREFSLGRTVALKILHPNSQGTESALRRFALEARSIAGLSSPHIVQIYEFNAEHQPPYIAMEYVSGGDLAGFIRKHDIPEVREFVEYARQLFTGLRSAHNAGIVHRDIKPANILLTPERVLKLSDFGLVRSLHQDAGLTDTGSTVGTVEYFPPEVAQGEKPGMYSDVYSAGITLYELLTGNLPFSREESALKLLMRIAQEAPRPPEVFRDDLPSGLRLWFAKVLAFRPQERYQNAGEALAGLLQSCPDLCSGAFVISPGQPVSADTVIYATSQPSARAGDGQPRREEREVPQAGLTAAAPGASPDGAQNGTGTPRKETLPQRLRSEDASSIIRLAIKTEREGKNALDEEQLVRLAQEAGISAAAARAAISDYRRAKQGRHKSRRKLLIGGAAAAAVLFLLYAFLMFGQPAPQTPRQFAYAQPNGTPVTATVPPHSEGVAVPTKTAKSLIVGRSWVRTGLLYQPGRQVLMVRSSTPGRFFAEMTAQDGDLPFKTATLHALPLTPAGFFGPLPEGGYVLLSYEPPVNKSAVIPVAPALEIPAAPGSLANQNKPAEIIPAQRAEENPNIAEVQVAVADRLRLAALPFAGKKDYSEGTGDVLATRLAQADCFQIIERVQVDRVIENLKLEQSAYFDQSTTNRLGQMLGAEYLIQGAVQEAGGEYRLSAKRIDAQSGKVLESVSVQGRNLFALQDELAEKILRAIQATELARL